MFPVPKNNHWQPTASITALKQRAQIIAAIRDFFRERQVLEVETPLLCRHGVTDPHLSSIQTRHGAFLQTSPEYAIKRLLAAGSGDIFQLGKAFRDDETGRLHNQEFTLLEWYRINYNHQQLINEVDEFLQAILHCPAAEKISYHDLFQQTLQINPHQASIEKLKQCASDHQLEIDDLNHKDDWLNLLLTHLIEPNIGRKKPIFIYDFPASQAALAKIRKAEYPVAERFECYYKSIELANGFHELTDANEQRRRFEGNNLQREKMGLASIPIDSSFMASLEHGLPNCAGVALGVARLIMLAKNANRIGQVMTFTQEPS